MTDQDIMLRCPCGAALGWTRYIRGPYYCERCALRKALGRSCPVKIFGSKEDQGFSSSAR
jgi:hypothetical protein